MDKTIKAKWLDALRSGKYEQGRGCLRSAEDQFCCLGVLVDLIAGDKWRLLPTSPYYQVLGTGKDAGLDRRQLDEVGFCAQVQANLMAFNDVKKMSFNQIADWIEENL